nr:tetratricopeptide repeat protein [Streptomyces sp. Xyl84]
MAGTGRQGRSRGEVNRRRARSQFFGRRAQLSQFSENLAKDPESETDPAAYLFHVRGVGGVGKSTLLRQWQETARRAGAVTAVVDEGDVHSVPQALEELARQLARQDGPLKEFDRAADQYRRDQEAAAEAAPASAPAGDGGTSVSSRVVAQAALGAASLIPGAGVVTAMTNPDTAAQGLDRLRAGVRARGRRGRERDTATLTRAFITELGRLCDRHRWVVLFLDTWEETARYLDEWLRDVLADAFGPLPLNVMVVLAGRDALAEREWAVLREDVQDIPLDVFTEAETRTLLATRGITEPAVVEAVWQLSMGLPLLVALLALAQPATVEDVNAGGDVVDQAVERFVQWIPDPGHRETVLSCALAPQLNEDVFTAAAPQEGRGSWEWLCRQPFVSGRGDFKQYHAVVRASMVRQQRAHSPQRWEAAHLRLADAHTTWRTGIEAGLPDAKRWGEQQWRQHRLAETYHRLCARPAVELAGALELAVHAAGEGAEVLRQWLDSFGQAAKDTTDPALTSWSERLHHAAASDHPTLTVLTALLRHGHLSRTVQAWAHSYRGHQLFLDDRDDEAVLELDRALAADPHNSRAWAYRGNVHRWLDHLDQALSDLTEALRLDPSNAWARARRGEAHRGLERYDDAIADFTAALDLDPADAWALGSRGQTHRQAGRHDDAVTDLTAALDLDPTLDWALAERGIAHRLAERFEDAVTDLTAALEPNPNDAVSLVQRGIAYWQTGRHDDAVTDLTAALDLDPTDAVPLAQRGIAHLLAERFEDAVTDLTAALELNPTLDWALAERGIAHLLAERFEDAVTDLTAALELNSTDAVPLAQRGIAHRRTGRYDDAVTDLTAALELNPTLDWALTERGIAHRQAGHYDKAVTDLTAALELNPTIALPLAQRGTAFRQAGRYDDAVTDLTAALDLAPSLDWALAARGTAHLQAARYDKAVTDLTAALELNPSLDWALAARGTAHRRVGNYVLARDDLGRAIALDPHDAEHRFELTMLDTVTSGPAACLEGWIEVLSSPPDDDAAVTFPLFRTLILEPETDVAVATEMFLSDAAAPVVAKLARYLAELAALDGAIAARARQCHQLITQSVTTSATASRQAPSG